MTQALRTPSGLPQREALQRTHQSMTDPKRALQEGTGQPAKAGTLLMENRHGLAWAA